MSNHLILWPMLVQVLLTLWMFVLLSRRKKAAVRAGGVDLKHTALHNDAWPDEVLKVSNNIQNQFQLPVLYYALCLMLAFNNGVSELVLAFAWLFAVSRLFHAYVHVTSNHVPHRLRIFIIGFLSLVAMALLLLSQIALG